MKEAFPPCFQVLPFCFRKTSYCIDFLPLHYGSKWKESFPAVHNALIVNTRQWKQGTGFASACFRRRPAFSTRCGGVEGKKRDNPLTIRQQEERKLVLPPLASACLRSESPENKEVDNICGGNGRSKKCRRRARAREGAGVFRHRKRCAAYCLKGRRSQLRGRFFPLPAKCKATRRRSFRLRRLTS